MTVFSNLATEPNSTIKNKGSWSEGNRETNDLCN